MASSTATGGRPSDSHTGATRRTSDASDTGTRPASNAPQNNAWKSSPRSASSGTQVPGATPAARQPPATHIASSRSSAKVTVRSPPSPRTCTSTWSGAASAAPVETCGSVVSPFGPVLGALASRPAVGARPVTDAAGHHDVDEFDEVVGGELLAFDPAGGGVGAAGARGRELGCVAEGRLGARVGARREQRVDGRGRTRRHGVVQGCRAVLVERADVSALVERGTQRIHVPGGARPQQGAAGRVGCAAGREFEDGEGHFLVRRCGAGQHDEPCAGEPRRHAAQPPPRRRVPGAGAPKSSARSASSTYVPSGSYCTTT